jgi:hypothetical protein
VAAAPTFLRDNRGRDRRAALSRPVSGSAVRNWLARHAQGDRALFVRLDRGRYVVVADDEKAGTACEPDPAEPGTTTEPGLFP